ncbi:MAG: hypothetical protein ACLGJC_29190 [Alphaproteobacteria bacterium]
MRPPMLPPPCGVDGGVLDGAACPAGAPSHGGIVMPGIAEL